MKNGRSDSQDFFKNTQLINKVLINWDKIDQRSYLRDIKAISGVEEIHRLVGEGAQFIIVSHSPVLLGFPGAEILSFDDGDIHHCDYEDTDSYQVISMFINNREQILKRLLEDCYL